MNYEKLTEHIDDEHKAYASEVACAFFKSLEELGAQLNIFSAPDVLEKLRSNAFQDFIYDRPTRTVITGGKNLHSAICSVLYSIHTLGTQKANTPYPIDPLELISKTLNPANDRPCISYLNEYGFYQSSLSQSPTIQMGYKNTLSADERLLFRHYRIEKIKPLEYSAMAE